MNRRDESEHTTQIFVLLYTLRRYDNYLVNLFVINFCPSTSVNSCLMFQHYILRLGYVFGRIIH